MNIDDLNPSGLTAFYDNVTITINKMCSFYKKTLQQYPIVIILTDGDDTCSKTLSMRDTAVQIALAKQIGWYFIFLGVTENSINIGRQIGCDICIKYTCSENSFEKIPNIIGKLLEGNNNIDTDIIDLTDSMLKTNIN
jgi:hypothetical protein